MLNTLKELRKANNLKQKELAEKLNIPYTTYNAYEIAKAIPPIDTLIKLAKFYNVSIDYLLTGNKEYNISQSEKELLAQYRQLNNKNQLKVLGYIDSLINI